MSEDTAFSLDVPPGTRMGATTHVKAGHISRVTTGWETYQEYLQLGGVNDWIGRYRTLLEQIAAYTGDDISLVEARVLQHGKNVRDAWTPCASAAEERAFYGRPDNGYLYDLAGWNCSQEYAVVANPLKELHDLRVLVVGSGIGGEIERLIERNTVDAMDIPGALRDFCQQRFPGVHFIERPEGVYDLVVMVDVVEHIHPDEFDLEMDELADHARAFYIHVNFGQQDIFPMHHDHRAALAAWAERHGLRQEGLWYKR